ncbi:hypothetical protein [Anaerosacchariphilus polymeriproducens]|uniref:P/Homo B domain-containing protein n=1 Tax=Anaerosacchariphilus polymeriproducens TaxID=1812858 RepID=A0A371B0C2_9FIRM|nr:hypothetical protein [Anaerosacchariphilus polymeriproducens]RDU25180.1 hypothetical protein DWV06_00440 [Anaerosacchariphilus polymeriproducens]
MKKILGLITSFVLLCIVGVMTVSAAEIPQEANVSSVFSEANGNINLSTNYFTGNTVKMNSYNGVRSTISNISSGTVTGIDPKVTSVTLNVTVSSGSSPFYLYVEDPHGNVDFTTVSKSSSVFLNSFNGVHPYGKWKVYIVTNGIVSTATARMKVNYSN